MIEVSNVCLTYQSDTGEVEALRNVSLTVDKGELCALVGPSGCGKSTLLGVIAGLETADSGTVTVAGKAVTAPGGATGLMPQQDQLFPWKTIFDNMLVGLQVQKRDTAENRAKVRTLLSRYALAEFAMRRPPELSGGMRQRCSLIRTMATEPEVLLLDEPFSALDYQTRLAVSADIHGILRREGMTALLVTHDIAEAVSMADRIFVLSRRPATIKAVYDLRELRHLTPSERRDHPSFHIYFNAIWKELDIHV